MPLPRTPVFWLLFWFSGGILLAYRLKPDLFSCGLLLLSVFLLLVPAYCKMGKKLPRFQALLIGLGFFVLGILTTAIRLPENKPGHFIHHWDREAGPIKVKLIKKLKASPWNQPYLAAVQRLQPPLYTGTVLLKISKEETEQLPEIGDQLTLWGKIEPIGPPLNPFQFDYKAYMQQNGVYGQLLVQAGDLYSIERKRKKNSSFGFTRERMVKSLSESGMDPSAHSLFQALILGDRTGLEAGLYRSYQRAGAAHILAVSGLHIGILAGMLHWLLKPLGRSVRKPWPIILIILSGLWGYAALSGFSPSVVRASLLFSFLSCSQVLRHPGFSLHFLGLAGIFMLSINPFWLLHVGFQLSFAAVGSILVFYKPLMALWPWKKGFLKRPGSLLAVSIAAQAGVLPFSLYYFHQFPGIFLLSNLLLIPGLGVLLLLGFIMLGMTSLGWLPELFITCYGKLLSLMNAAVQGLGDMDAFFFENIRWDLTASIFLVLILSGFTAIRLRIKRNFLMLSLLGVIGLAGWNIFSVIKDRAAREFCIPHKVAASGFWLRQKGNIDFYRTDSLAFLPLLADLKSNVRIDRESYYPLQNSYTLGNRKLLIIDESGVYPCTSAPVDLLWIRESPKIHLDRILTDLNPKQVIVDGSNYKNDITLWEKTCKSKGIPLHVTASDGAFLLNF